VNLLFIFIYLSCKTSDTSLLFICFIDLHFYYSAEGVTTSEGAHPTREVVEEEEVTTGTMTNHPSETGEGSEAAPRAVWAEEEWEVERSRGEVTEWALRSGEVLPYRLEEEEE
jgi:hypothetical protein